MTPRATAIDAEPAPRRLSWTFWKTLLWIAGASLLAVGFDFDTPRHKFALQDERITANTIRILSTESKIDVLLKLSCLDSRFSSRDWQLVGFDCGKVLNGAMQAGVARVTP